MRAEIQTSFDIQFDGNSTSCCQTCSDRKASEGGAQIGPTVEAGVSPRSVQKLGWRIKTLLIVCPSTVLLLMLSFLIGPDPRYLLVHEGMTEDRVRLVMGKPDVMDESLDGKGAWAWFYFYSTSTIIVEWSPQSTVQKKIFMMKR